MANRSDIPSAESMGGVGGADRAAADTPSGGSTGLQTLAIETALVPVNSELAALRRQLNDQGRQTSKDEIVFEGTAVRRVEGETERQLLQRLVKTYWGLDLKGFESNHVDEIKQVHWLPGKSEEKEPKRLLAKFLNLYNGSSFHKILHTKPKVPASGRLVTEACISRRGMTSGCLSSSAKCVRPRRSPDSTLTPSRAG